MVSPAAAVAEAHARLRRLRRAVPRSGVYYGVHIGEVYLRYYRLLRRDAASGPACRPVHRRARSRRRLAAHADSILGQTPRFPDRARRPAEPDHHPDRVHRYRRPPGLQPHLPLLRPPVTPRSRAGQAHHLGVSLSPPRRARRRPVVSGAGRHPRRGQAAGRARRAHRPAGGPGRAASPACLLGGSVLGVVPDGRSGAARCIHVLAELGVLLLLFEIGLETDLARDVPRRARRRSRSRSWASRCRFGFGYVYWALPAARRERQGDLTDRGHLRRRHAHGDVGRDHRAGAVRSGPHEHRRGPHHHRRGGHRRRARARDPERREPAWPPARPSRSWASCGPWR